MMNKKNMKKISKKNLLIAFSFATLFFIAGIFLGNIVVENKYYYLINTIDDFNIETQAAEIQYEILKENPCVLLNSSLFDDELDTLGNRISYLENIYGKSAEEIIFLKKQYTLLEIRHWLLNKKINEDCEVNKTTNKSDIILYFYSNYNCNMCEEQGNILSVLKKEYRDSIKIYSFDIILDDPASKTLRELYNIEDTPVIVFNDIVFRDFVNYNQLKKIIRKEQN